MDASHLTVINLPEGSNGIGRLAGTWSEAVHKEFLSAIESFEEIDQEFWKRAPVREIR